jgi:hypothetical protein
VELGQVFPCRYHSTDAPPTHLHLHVALTRRTNGPGLGNFQKALPFQKSASIEQKNNFPFFSIQKVKVGGEIIVIYLLKVELR